MKRFYRVVGGPLVLLLIGAAAIGCSPASSTTDGGVRDGGDGSVSTALVMLNVTPPMAQVAKGTSQQFAAVGIFSDGSTKDVTAQAAWTSSATPVATVGASTGKATGAGLGMATITAAYLGKSGSAALTVTMAEVTSVVVTPTSAMVAPMTTTQLVAMATFGDGTMQDVTDQVAWASDTPSVAIVDGKGLVTGVGAGAAAISATLAGKTASSIIMVSAATVTALSIAPSIATIAKGTTQSFQATALFSDGHTQTLITEASWAVDPTSVATVNAIGLATGVAGGTATVTAAFMGKSATSTLTVTEAKLTSLAITPANPSVTKGATRQFTATGTFSEGAPQDLTAQVTWASDASAVATVSNAAGSRGLATGIGPGTAHIGVAFLGVTASTTLTVAAAPPVVNVIAPTMGGQDGGTTVKITGSGFTGASSVKFGTTFARSFNVVSDTEISAVSPAGRAVASLIVTTASGISNALYFSYVPPPTLTRVDPFSGPEAGGTMVALTGTGFTGATQVTFGTKPATSFMVVSDTMITALSPSGTGSVNVTVVNPYGRSGRVAFSYGAAPSVAGVSPTSGSEAGGTAVAITGLGLADAVAVFFGPTPAQSFTQVSPTQINAVSPAGMGPVNVSVITPSGTSNGLVFTYRSAPQAGSASPAAGPTEGGNTIFITGAGFTGATAVTFGGTAATFFTVISDTEISAVAPASGAGNVEIRVTTPLGTSAGMSYASGPRPTIGSLEPATGPLTGGIVVTITGTALGQTQAVYLDATSVSFTIVNDTTVTFTLPAGTGTVNVKVVNPYAESLTSPFGYGPSPVITSLTPDTGPQATGATVIIAGANFTGATAVNFDATPAVLYTVNSATQITAVAPAGLGIALVTVTTPYATSNTATYTHVAAPLITSFSPSSGPTVGGTSVSIIGTHFSAATMVTFGASAASSFTVLGDTNIVAVAPAGSGMVPIQVITPYGSDTAIPLFTYIPPPVLTSVLPATGPTAGAVAVTLLGTNFTGATAVTFGATPATSFNAMTDGIIIATAPAGAAGMVNVAVTTPSGTSNTSPYTYVLAPSITSISPSAGSVGGGTVVTVTGQNFTADASASFGALSGGSFTFDSATQITVTTPAQSGVVAVTVTNPYGTSNSQPFSYGPVPVVSSLDRTGGSTLGGQTVVVTGTSFTLASAVTFGATPAASFTVDSPTQITAVTPVGAVGSANVTVTNPYGTSNGGTFQFGLVPSITSLSRSSGDHAGGYSVIVMGTSLGAATGVTIGGQTAAFTLGGPVALFVTVPPGSDGPATLVVTNAYGDSAGATFTYGPPPAVSTIMPDKGPITGGTTVTINGTNLTGATTVFFNHNPATGVTVNSDTQITAVSPPALAGVVAITVTTPFGGNPASPGFTYGVAPVTSGLSPTSGAEAGGTTVVITGTDLTFATAVKFDSTDATSFVVDSATQITAVAPAGTGVVTVSVTTPYGMIGGLTYTYVPAPVVSSLSLTTGGASGGTVVTITGSSFTSVSSVTFGATPATSFTVNSPTQITATVPAGSPGAVGVTVTTAYGSNTLAGGFTYYPAPTISMLSLTGGPTAGATTITVTGTGLATATSVTIGGLTATPTMLMATSLQFVTPAHAAGAVTVSVTNGSGTSGPLGYTYYDAPVVTSLSPSPAVGSTAGGTTVTVHGVNLTGTTSVTFGSTPGTSVAVVDDNTVTVVSPAGTPGAVFVNVFNPGGSFTSPDSFYYYAAPSSSGPASPNAGATVGGDTVTFSGSNLQDAVSVTFGGVSATISGNTNTSLSVTTPAHAAGAVDVIVTTPGGSFTLTSGFTYVSAPVITMVSPSGGPVSGATVVTITGSGFTGATDVTFDGDSAIGLTVDSDTQITAVTPGASSARDVEVDVIAPGGTASGAFTYADAPVITMVVKNVGSLAGGETVVITGQVAANRVNSVTFGGVEVASISHTTIFTEIQVTAPGPHAAGLVPLVVSGPGGSDSTVYRYAAAPTITSITPNTGDTAGGTSIMIVGTNFYSPTVTFGGVAGTSISVPDSTHITINTPAHAMGAVNVVVQTGAGSATQVGGFTYTMCLGSDEICTTSGQCCSGLCSAGNCI